MGEHISCADSAGLELFIASLMVPAVLMYEPGWNSATHWVARQRLVKRRSTGCSKMRVLRFWRGSVVTIAL